jgi:serine/threonine protein phosphatase PrpC
VRASQVTTCPACGGTVAADGYCQTCGAKAPSPRDHFQSSPAAWVGGVCDRGVQHLRNEDAMALWARDDRAVLVVCDGVSTSIDSDVAALAGAETACDVLAASTPGKVGDEELAAALVDAAARANAAVVAHTAADSANAASATFAAAVVVGDRVHFANLGDSRVYLLGASERLLLSVDDSMAQAFIAEGMPREEAEALPRAHAITKWLGRDASDVVPRTGAHRLTEPGWLVVCTDGLWNYASAPDELAVQLAVATATGDDPTAVAGRLVEWANDQGGHDNVTVALARVPAPEAAATPASLEAAPTDLENGATREHG